MNKRNGLLRLASAALAAALCLTACGAPAASSAPQPTETPAAVGGENVTLGGRDAQGHNGAGSTCRAEATQMGGAVRRLYDGALCQNRRDQVSGFPG